MLRCEICDQPRNAHILLCPIHSDCPEAIAGRCAVYGYCLNILGDPHYKKNYLNFCVNYVWRIKRFIKVDEYTIATHKNKRRKAIQETQLYYTNHKNTKTEMFEMSV